MSICFLFLPKEFQDGINPLVVLTICSLFTVLGFPYVRKISRDDYEHNKRFSHIPRDHDRPQIVSRTEYEWYQGEKAEGRNPYPGRDVKIDSRDR